MQNPPAGTPKDQAELFRQMASRYDDDIRVYQPTYDDMLHLSTDFSRAAASGHARCLDYGTGTGAALPRLAHHFDELVGVDPGPAMLDVARARVERELGDAASKVSFIQGTTATLPAASLEEKSFDAVHCSLVMMFVKEDEDKLSMLRVLHRALRPGGVLVLTELVADAVPNREQEILTLWLAVMSLRGAADDVVVTGERQVHSHMHRRSATEVLGLLEAAGFTQAVQAYQALHTVMFVARR